MLITIMLFILGFLFLVKGADLLVDGSVWIAKRLKVSNLVIGLTIVSFGTSLPELVVNVFASGQGDAQLAIANVIGSNVANILLILGVTALICPPSVRQGTVWREIPFSLLAIFVLAILANDVWLDGFGANMISRSDGLVMIAFLVIFMYYIYGVAVKDRKRKFEIEETPEKLPKSFAHVAVGLVGLVIGGNWVVSGAIEIAGALGLSTTFIGLTIVALGTSLPELVTSAVAAYKKNAELAVGNAVGSNIFNILWILGLSAIIQPLPFFLESNFDIIAVVVATLLLFAWMFVGKKRELQKWQGVVFLFIYAAYIMAATIRG
ncbi:calcium/sodium antiporter [Candidatus Uhrbacteria bacterium]|nr:calcium/sodium antiporter [Candidatus Uhrbacteria bacterium]